ncbi:hypothetical protein JCM10207_001039 [Rhodosporidiobolus poonsookiae]
MEGIAATIYGRKSRELVGLMTQLRACGASADLDLPRIANIGNQSAGKSSLVEAISGIKVLRDAGTCTRCPMEVRLRCVDTPWSCRISLRFERDADNKPVESYFLELTDEGVLRAKGGEAPSRSTHQLSFSTNLVRLNI